MAVIPNFESLLLEVRQSLGLERLSSKKQEDLLNLDMSLTTYRALLESELEKVFDALELDTDARRDASLNLFDWNNFQQALIQRTWTCNASPQQVVWYMSGYCYAPAIGRILANWNLEGAFDKGMPGGEFWFLPSNVERTQSLVLPVQKVVSWLMDLLDLPMDKLKLDLGGKRAKRIDGDTYDSMERSLYNWLDGKTPHIQSIESYFPDDAQLEFKGTFEPDSQKSHAERFADAKAFLRHKGLDADSLRDQIPITQPGVIEAILAGESPVDIEQEFIRLLAIRYGKPDMRTVRQRLRVARMVLDGYKRLVKFLCPGIDPTCTDPYQNKVLQLIGIVETIYNISIGAYKNCDSRAEEDAWFESKLAPWDKETIFLSILPSRFDSAFEEVPELLTREFAKLDPTTPLEDLVPMDEANAQRIIQAKLKQLKSHIDEAERAAYLRGCVETSLPWSPLENESSYWVVGQVAQEENLSASARERVIKRMRELATTPGQFVGAILIELHMLLNAGVKERPVDVENRVKSLIAEADASPGKTEWEAALLQYKAKHHLAQNDFKLASNLFRAALDASAERNCGSMRGEIARDCFAASLVNRRLSPRDHEKPYRHMLASDVIEGVVVTLEKTAKAVARYFSETLYKPYPSYPKQEVRFNF